MNERERHQWEKWKHLIYAAESLAEIEQGPRALERVIQCLESVEEVFPKSLDPLEDFEGFALRQFVKTLKSALAAQAGRSARSSVHPLE